MILISFSDIILENFRNTTWLEAVAVATGLLSVWYAKKENILVKLARLGSVLNYVYICFFAKLYADMGINFFYFIMSVYGWYNWSRKDQDKKTIPISGMDSKEWILSISAFVVFFIVLSYSLTHFTDSNVPIWDSLTTAIFLVSMWLMAKKKIENWLGWIVGDIISIPLYAYKGLILTSLQFTIFLIIAVLGYLEWRRKLLKASNNTG